MYHKMNIFHKLVDKVPSTFFYLLQVVTFSPMFQSRDFKGHYKIYIDVNKLHR